MPSSFDNMIYACIFMFTAGVSGRITDPPLNAVADVGGQAILNCTSDLTVQNWVFSKTREEVDGNMPTVQTIVAGCVVQPGFTTNYEVDRPGGSNNKCNLIVKATTMQQAGVYTCTDTIAGPSSILTVIDGDASITVDKQEETVEEDVVTMSYTVRYSTSTASPNTPTIQPVLSWKDPDGNNITSSNSNTSTSVSTNISIKAERQDIRPYTCNISFEIKWPSPPTGLPFANNTPSSLSNPPPTSTINVLYGPSVPVVTSRPEVITVNGMSCGISVLTCSSTGNPVPSYRWFDSAENVILSTNNILDLAEVNRNYKCEAYNTIRNMRNSNSSTYTVSTNNCSTFAQCCVFPRNETTIATEHDCGTEGLCDCSPGKGGINLTCNAATYPTSLYRWIGPDGKDMNINSPFNDQVTANGTYSCTAYFDRTSSNYSGSVSFSSGNDDIHIGECFVSPRILPTAIPSTVTTDTSSFEPISTTSCTSSSDYAVLKSAAIALGSILFVSITANVIQLILLIRNQRTKHVSDPARRAGPLSNAVQGPSTYEELRHPNGIHLEATNYEQLTPKLPLYINQ